MHLNELAKLIRTAGDENRLQILCVLFKHTKLCVSEIAQETGISIATTSHHLQSMSDVGLVTAVREGKKICYMLPKDNFSKDLRKFICTYL